ncbi:nucleotidyltransferase family protein [uncultured Methanobrevibacter sp.]|uniref:nucleotidyltransferase family protein n=1 Tax=uncultured Methanobrevibacter sp. TaxID=253161 RepID=UPI0025F36646|nr:nucleotidyltransferase family protein [uncultured Methanobrevibacter sp.]
MDFIKDIQREDRKTFFNDFEKSQKSSDLKWDNESKVSEDKSRPLIADFTEYSPLHNGHFHCMKTAKAKVPYGLFVAVVPGLFERSGRGLPYILHRRTRAEIAIAVGADIVVEGPPMGIMGSGQYSLCLTKMFQALNTDFIPRGYRPFDGYEKILERISLGHGVAPKPYRIVDMDTKEVIYNGKLEEDNYVIVSFSKSLKKIGFDFKDKFIFVPRIEGVSGTLIRKACSQNNLESVKSMLPSETARILEREINEDRAPLHDLRDEETIIDSANNLSYDELLKLNFFNEKLANELISKRDEKPFESLSEIEESIFYGFSSHFKNRVLSILETRVNADVISEYINNYPSTVRVLNYKNEDVLDEFKEKVLCNEKRFVNDIVIS